MKKEKLMTLKKLLLNLTFAVVSTDKGEITVDGEKIVEGADVFMTDAEGNEVPAEDGEYSTDEVKFTVKDGKVESVEELKAEEEEAEAPAEEKAEELAEEPAEEPADEQPEEPAKDEKDEKIAELEAIIAQKDAEIAALQLEIEGLKNKADAPVEEPISNKPAVNETNMSKTYGPLKYFQK